MLMDPDLPNLRAVLDKADVVVEVLDARDPQTFRSAELEKYMSEAGKKAMFVMNKIGAWARLTRGGRVADGVPLRPLSSRNGCCVVLASQCGQADLPLPLVFIMLAAPSRS